MVHYDYTRDDEFMKKSRLTILIIFLMGSVLIFTDIYLKNSFSKKQHESEIKQDESYQRSFAPENGFFVSDISDSKGCIAFDIIKAKCKYSIEKIGKVSKTQNNANELWLRDLQLVSQSSDFKNLEQEALKNNRCSGQELELLFYIYSQLNLQEKAVETKQVLLRFAATNNFSAIRSLCNDPRLSLKDYRVRLLSNVSDALKEEEIGVYQEGDNVYCKLKNKSAFLVDKKSTVYDVILARLQKGSGKEFTEKEIQLINGFTSAYNYTPQTDRVRYCENIIENKDIDNNDATRNDAYSNLISYFRFNQQKNELITLCKKISGKANNSDSSFALSATECLSAISGYSALYDGVSGISAPDVAPFSKEDYNQVISMCEKRGNVNNDYPCYFIRQHYFTYLIQLADKSFSNKDYSQALDLYKEATDYDESGASFFMIGSIYSDGAGINQDFNVAIYWYQRALEKMRKNKDAVGIASAIEAIGEAYERLQNYVAAFEYYYKAATMGDAYGQYNLSRMYYLGRGRIQDKVQAFAWGNVATAQGLQDKEGQNKAEQFKRILSISLTRASDMDEAMALAKKYYSQYVLHEQPKQ